MTQICVSIPTTAMVEGVVPEKCFCIAGTHIEKAVLSTCSIALERSSSAQVGPRRALFWVVAYTGIERTEAALRSFWVVVMLNISQNGENEGCIRRKAW